MPRRKPGAPYNSWGGHRRPRGLTPKTLERMAKLEELFKANPDIPKVRLAERIGWTNQGYLSAKRALNREKRERASGDQ